VVEAEARIGEPREGVVFLPFHFGYWDNPDGPPTAANELTVTAWDPVSKQPMFKVAAVRVRKVV
jgi:anaerobic selenocysteine-containing dehydrogenase